MSNLIRSPVVRRVTEQRKLRPTVIFSLEPTAPPAASAKRLKLLLGIGR